MISNMQNGYVVNKNLGATFLPSATAFWSEMKTEIIKTGNSVRTLSPSNSTSLELDMYICIWFRASGKRQ